MIFEEFSGTDRRNFSKYFWSAIRQKIFFRFFHVSDDSEQLSILPGKKNSKIFPSSCWSEIFRSAGTVIALLDAE